MPPGVVPRVTQPGTFIGRYRAEYAGEKQLQSDGNMPALPDQELTRSGFCAIGIPAEGTRSGLNRGCIDLYSCGFDVLVRLETSVGSEGLDRSVVLRAIATVGMAFGGAGGIYVTVFQLGFLSVWKCCRHLARRTGCLRRREGKEAEWNKKRDYNKCKSRSQAVKI